MNIMDDSISPLDVVIRPDQETKVDAPHMTRRTIIIIVVIVLAFVVIALVMYVVYTRKAIVKPVAVMERKFTMVDDAIMKQRADIMNTYMCVMDAKLDMCNSGDAALIYQAMRIYQDLAHNKDKLPTDWDDTILRRAAKLSNIQRSNYLMRQEARASESRMETMTRHDGVRHVQPRHVTINDTRPNMVHHVMPEMVVIETMMREPHAMPPTTQGATIVEVSEDVEEPPTQEVNVEVDNISLDSD